MEIPKTNGAEQISPPTTLFRAAVGRNALFLKTMVSVLSHCYWRL